MVRIPVANDRRVDSWRNATTMDYLLRKESFLGTETRINFIVEIIDDVAGTLLFADKPIYVDGFFYEARLKIPEVKNQLSELLDPAIEASEVELTIDNNDGAYNKYLVGGAEYTSFIGAVVNVYYGVGSVLSTGYIRIFQGQVHQEGAASRNVKTITLRARDLLSIYVGNKLAPELIDATLTPIPQVSVQFDENKPWPYAMGDWGYDRYGDDGFGGLGTNDNNIRDVAVLEGIKGTYLGIYNFTGQGITGENGVSLTGNLHVVAVADTVLAPHHMQLVSDSNNTAGKTRPHNFVVQNDQIISIGDTVFDFWRFNATDTIHYYAFDDFWQSAVTTNHYTWQSGDTFIFYTYPANDDDSKTNDDPVTMAKTMLMVFANLPEESFDGFTWGDYATPGQSFRWYYQKDDRTLIQIVLSILKQHRLDLFITKDATIKLCSLRTEKLTDPTQNRQIENMDINEDSVEIELLRKEFMNYAQGKFNFIPFQDETIDSTPVRRNMQSLNKSEITTGKLIDLPNHADADIALEHVDELVRLFAAGLEFVDMELSYKHIDIEPGEFVTVSFSPGFLLFDNVPMQVRMVSIDPQTAFVNIRCVGLGNYAWTAYDPSNVAQFLSTSSAVIT
jgi:hypothetical protein